jgi:hypothetical protein
MWATCLKEPEAGPEIIDLLILPFFADFLVGEEAAFAEGNHQPKDHGHNK